MEENKTLFVISDIHGYYREMLEALQKAGFDPSDADHVLVSLGDLFDRGPDSVRVFRYIMALPRKILIRGNHELRLQSILEQRYVQSYDYSNGTVDTLHAFFGIDCVAHGGIFMTSDDDPTYRQLLAYLQGARNYYEWGDYIFTHGWLPIDDSVPPRLLPSWRSAPAKAWHNACWLEWQQLYKTNAKPRDKVLVCGHRSANMAYWFDPARTSSDYSTFFGDGVIVLDACTAVSGQVNVLVLSSMQA